MIKMSFHTNTKAESIIKCKVKSLHPHGKMVIRINISNDLYLFSGNNIMLAACFDNLRDN